MATDTYAEEIEAVLRAALPGGLTKPTLVVAVILVRDAHLKGAEVAALVRALQHAQTQAEALQILSDQRDGLRGRIAQGELGGSN